MEEKIAVCGNLAMAFSDNSWTYGTDNSGVAGYSSGFRVAVIRFDAPVIAGASKYLNIGMIMSRAASSNSTIRWAVCKSDLNRSKYMETSDEVEDEFQVASGTVRFENLTNVLGERTFQIPVKGIRKGTWYLILWASELTGIYLRSVISNYGSYSISVVYNGAILWIATSEGPKPCIIYNGRKQQMIPYVKTRTGLYPPG